MADTQSFRNGTELRTAVEAVEDRPPSPEQERHSYEVAQLAAHRREASDNLEQHGEALDFATTHHIELAKALKILQGRKHAANTMASELQAVDRKLAKAVQAVEQIEGEAEQVYEKALKVEGAKGRIGELKQKISNCDVLAADCESQLSGNETQIVDQCLNEPFRAPILAQLLAQSYFLGPRYRKAADAFRAQLTAAEAELAKLVAQ